MNKENIWISCLDCGQRVGRNSIHTCSPQTKPLSDDETIQLACDTFYGLIKKEERDNFIRFAKAIEERHGIK